MALFQGLSAFPITPADGEGRVDEDGLCRLLARLGAAGVDSVGLLGSTGGFAYLTRAERRRAVEAAAGCLAGAVPLMVGVGALRTDAAVALARDAAQAGADALLLPPVSYTPLTEEEAFQHYLAVAGASGLPLCIYNNPTTTHFSFSPALLRRLAALPTVAAVKMPLPADGDLQADLRGLRDALPEGFLIGYSADWGCARALLAGADAWYSVVAGILPVPALALTRAAMAGDAAEAGRLDARFEPLWALFRKFGGLRVVYAIAHELGLTEAAPPRPILPLAPADRDRVAAALDALRAPA